jgi:uncharacterized protein with GYD domain
MPTFLMISKHSPENCPVFNEKVKKTALAYMNKMDAWAKKYGIKVIGTASVFSEHLNIMIFEAPDLQAIQKVGMEPEAMAMSAYTHTEVKLALNTEETMKMLGVK